MSDEISSFTDHHWFLSNFYPSPVKYEGKTYSTVEHAYQAAKSLDSDIRESIRRAKKPSLAKSMGRRVFLRPGWEGMKIGIMKELLVQKFKDPGLKQSLLDTGNKQLIEGNTWGDTFWGVCQNVGKNHLGKLLMEIRGSL